MLKALIGIDATVAEKWPVLPRLIDLAQVAFDHQHLILIRRSFGNYASEGIGDERLAPEVELAFRSNAIDNHYINSVCNRMRALNRLPGGMLGLLHFLLFVRQPANRCWIEKKLCATHGGQACGFGKPLVPADQRPDSRILRIVSLETQISRREIKLLVVERVVRYVHLAILARNLAVSINDHRCVVIEAGGAFFKERSNDDKLLLSRYFSQRVGCWTGN